MSKPYHLRFRNFHPKALEVTDMMMQTKVSSLRPQAQLWHMQQWVDWMATIYRFPPPTVEFSSRCGDGCYMLRQNRILLPHASLITLMHEFRHAMQTFGVGGDEADEDDARAWSLSLYYRVRPKRFCKLVRAGKVLHLSPEAVDRKPRNVTNSQVEELFPET